MTNNGRTWRFWLPVVMIAIAIGYVLGVQEPEAQAQAARTSLASLQAEINELNTFVDALQADLETNYMPKEGGTFTGDVNVEGKIEAETIKSAGGVQVGVTSEAAGTANQGMLRWNTGRLEVSDGVQWRVVGNDPPDGNIATYRWNVWSSYDQGGLWIANNNPDLFGGTTPQAWGDGDGTISTTDRAKLGTLFTRTGRARGNATVVADSWRSYSSTNSKHAGVLFRIKNSTNAAINWTPSFYYTSNSGWNERASVTLNGTVLWIGNSNLAVLTASIAMSIPANSTSTAIFVSASSPTSVDMRTCFLAFHNNSLLLPAGLSYVDDLND